MIIAELAVDGRDEAAVVHCLAAPKHRDAGLASTRGVPQASLSNTPASAALVSAFPQFGRAHTASDVLPRLAQLELSSLGSGAQLDAARLIRTDAIEALNRQLRKAIKTKGHFPTEDAARKMIYLAIQNAAPQRTRTRGWTKASGVQDPLRRPTARLTTKPCLHS
jgi:hypothetical protein